jgi:methionyl-tRNA synthetase
VGACPKCKTPNQYGDVCEACGATYEPTDISDPHCIVCNNVPVLKQSRHFYVELAKCEGFLREFIATPGVLQEDMRNFVTSWINAGLREWCVSRDAPYFGFRIPGTENKYFYVWLDAPIGYISSTEKWCKDNGRRVEEFWSPQSGTKVVHFIGKDIVQFHLLFWPVMLKNSNFNLPSTVFVHGYLNTRGEKMSKSRGTSIFAKDFLAQVKHPQAPEYLRFFFASKLSSTIVDIDLNAGEFVNRVNASLANNIGNLHHRTFVFCDRYFDKRIPDAPWDETIAGAVETAARDIAQYYERADYKAVIERVHALGSLGNKYYQDGKPWDLIKTDAVAAAKVMVTCANLVRAIAVFLKPIIPEICGSLERQLGAKFSWNDYVFSLSGKPLLVTEKLVIPLTDEDIAPLFGQTAQPAAVAAEDGSIDIAAFKAVDLRVAKIIAAQRIEKSKKLLKLQCEIGAQKRQILAGIAEHYAPEELVGKLVIVILNLKPAKLMGLESQGMVLAATDEEGKLSLLFPDKSLLPGAKVS